MKPGDASLNRMLRGEVPNLWCPAPHNPTTPDSLRWWYHNNGQTYQAVARLQRPKPQMHKDLEFVLLVKSTGKSMRQIAHEVRGHFSTSVSLTSYTQPLIDWAEGYILTPMQQLVRGLG